MPKRLVIAIDGPSGAGKSTVARLLAQRLGYSYIESGAMYRALALRALEAGINVDDVVALAALAHALHMQFEWRDWQNRVLLDGRDVTEAIRTTGVTGAASKVSVHAAVRRELVARQREFGRDGGVIMEGRDIGTKVFPDADIKVFLDASLAARSRRRALDSDMGGQQDTEAVQREIAERDRRDRERQQSPLVAAPDAIRIDSTDLTAEQVVERIVELAKAAISKLETTR